MPAVKTCRSGRSLVFLAALCVAAAGRIGHAADVGSAPWFGSFGVNSPNPPGNLGTLTVENAVHDASGSVYVSRRRASRSSTTMGTCC